MACHIHRGVLLSAAFLFVRMPHSKMRRLNAAVSHSASAPPTRSLASSSQKALTQNKGADARLRRCSAAQALTHNTGSGAECIRAALYEGCSRVALAPLRAVQGGRKHILNTSSTLSSAPQRSRDAPCACACPCPALAWPGPASPPYLGLAPCGPCEVMRACCSMVQVHRYPRPRPLPKLKPAVARM